jgi:hypothetical protein
MVLGRQCRRGGQLRSRPPDGGGSTLAAGTSVVPLCGMVGTSALARRGSIAWNRAACGSGAHPDPTAATGRGPATVRSDGPPVSGVGRLGGRAYLCGGYRISYCCVR